MAAYIPPRTIPAANFSFNLLQKARMPGRVAHRHKVPPVSQPGDPPMAPSRVLRGVRVIAGGRIKPGLLLFPVKARVGARSHFHPDNICGSVCRNAADFLRNSSYTSKMTSVRPGCTL